MAVLAASAGRKRAPLSGRRAVSLCALGTIEKSMSLVPELLGNLAPHGVDDVSLTCPLLSCSLDYRINDLPKVRYPGKVE